MHDFSYTVAGFSNPVRAFAAAIKAMEIPFDADSFDHVARQREPLTIPDGGFVVRKYDDLQRLCQIGNFAAIMQAGVISAVLPAEIPAYFQQHQAPTQRSITVHEYPVLTIRITGPQGSGKTRWAETLRELIPAMSKVADLPVPVVVDAGEEVSL